MVFLVFLGSREQWDPTEPLDLEASAIPLGGITDPSALGFPHLGGILTEVTLEESSRGLFGK